jgi:hypothetical protein
VHLRGRAAAASTADLQLGWSMPSGSTILRSMWGGGEDATGGPTGWTTAMFRSVATDAGLPHGMSGTGAPRPLFEDVDLVPGDARRAGRRAGRQGNLEEACATWSHALDAMHGVRSRRTRQVAIDMRSVLSPFRRRGIRTVAELDARAVSYLRE